MELSIISPMQNSLMERNYFKIYVQCDSKVKQVKFQLFNCNDRNNHKLVLEEVKLNLKEDTELSIDVSPYHVQEDGLYGIVISIDNELALPLHLFKIKAAQGWETITQLNQSIYNLKNKCAISNVKFFNDNLAFIMFESDHGKLYNIDPITFKIEGVFNISDVKENTKVFFWNNLLFKIEKNIEDVLTISFLIADNEMNKWFLFAKSEETVNDDYMFFINSDHNLVVLYKKTEDLHVLYLDTNMVKKEYSLNITNLDYKEFILGDSSYLNNESDHSVILFKILLNDNTKKLVKLKLKDDNLSSEDPSNEVLTDYPEKLNNPIFMISYNRIYWNYNDKKDASIESWDVHTLEKNRVIPFGGTYNFKNNVDGKLYSIGTKSETPGMMYLKRYIE